MAEGRFCNDAEKLAGRLLAELQFSTVEEIFDRGLHRLPGRGCRSSSTTSAARLFDAYIFQPFENPDEEHMVQQEEQQQQLAPAGALNP